MLAELVRKNRTYRRFYQDVPITRETLEELVDLARLAASGGNRQPLKYLLFVNRKKCSFISSIGLGGIFKRLARTGRRGKTYRLCNNLRGYGN